MSVTVVASTSSHGRIAIGQDWLKARRPAEEVLIIGPTLIAANEIARSIARTKGASTAKADFRKGPCPLYPRKRTCAVHKLMSALGQ
jgi:hypothetical protein